MRNVEDLKVWQACYELALAVYKETRHWPPEERFNLTSQAQRAASGAPAHIAEGYGRFSDAELRRYCQIAHGSLCELSTHLRLARDLGYCPMERWTPLNEKLQGAKAPLLNLLQKLNIDISR
jgi:four helix bundle protein